MKAVRETEKAIAIKAMVYVVYAPASGFTSSLTRDKEFETLVWIPKSQLINGNPSNWILGKKKESLREEEEMRVPYLVRMNVTFVDADNKEVKGEMSEYDKQREARKEEAFKKGCEKHDALVEEAKSLGIKGVRKNMRTETLEDMIAEAKKQKEEVKEEANDDAVVTFDEEVEVEDFTEEELDAVVESIIEGSKNEEYVVVTANLVNNEIVIGCEVSHKMFGSGIVASMDENTISVNFGGEIKNLVRNYSRLTRIN